MQTLCNSAEKAWSRLSLSFRLTLDWALCSLPAEYIPYKHDLQELPLRWLQALGWASERSQSAYTRDSPEIQCWGVGGQGAEEAGSQESHDEKY